MSRTPLRRLRVTTRLAGLGMLAATTFVSVGQTQAQLAQPSATNEGRAETLFRAGERNFDSGQFKEACGDFAESLRLGPKLGTLLNLALCHETVGRTATAWSEFHHASAWAAQNGQKDRQDFARRHALVLEAKLPRILLQLPTDRAIGSVDIDGEPLPDSRWYLPVFLDPGEHSVTLSAPGKQRGIVKFRVVASPTEQLVSVPALDDERQAEPLPSPKAVPASDPDRVRRIVSYATLGVGVGSLAAGTTFGILAIGKRDEIGSRCVAARCTEAGAQLYRDAQASAGLATVSLAVGVVASAVGTWLLATSRSRSPGIPAPSRIGLSSRADVKGAAFGVWGTF